MEAKLLKTISDAQSFYIKGRNKWEVFEYLLENLLNITGSEYGFIGEILYDENSMPFLRTYATTNIAWNDELKKMYKENRYKGLDFVKLNTLFGLVITENKIIISNDPKNDPRRGGELKIPHGHPSLNSFAGIPFYHKENIIGMVGIANRENGYLDEYIDKLRPFIDTCSVLTTGYKMADRYSNIQAESNSYVSRLSHDLRTPLNAIFGYCQLIELEDDLDEILAYNDVINKSAKILLNIVNDVLLISNNSISVEIKTLDLHKILLEQIEMVKPMCLTKNISIDYIPEKDINILADEKLFKNVVINILANAVKYNKIDGDVIIKISVEDKYIRIDVIDTGVGINQIYLEQIFDPFFRSDNVQHIEGNGLGLSIVKKNLLSMNGNIYVKSEKGKGSIFSIIIPADLKPFVKKEVLYVEDHVHNQMLLKTIAKKFKFNLDIANSIEEAKQLLNDHEYKLYLLDMGLPDGCGLELVPLINSKSIAAITADASLTTRKKIYETGIEHYFTKPFNITEVTELIKTFID